MDLYQEQVRRVADRLWSDLEDAVIEDLSGIADGAFENALDTALDALFESSSFTLSDAAFVLKEAASSMDNYELSSGDEDYEQALINKAKVGFFLDVRNELSERHEAASEEMDGFRESYTEDHGREADEARLKSEADTVFTDRLPEFRVVSPGSVDEKRNLLLWFELCDASSYPAEPLGSSYRGMAAGFGQPQDLRFEHLDSDLARTLPHLKDRRRDELEEYYLETHLGVSDRSSHDEIKDKLFELAESGGHAAEYKIVGDLIRKMDLANRAALGD